MGENGNYFSGINGNGNNVSEFRSPGMGVGLKSWEWEGMVCQKLFPHTSSLDLRGQDLASRPRPGLEDCITAIC